MTAQTALDSYNNATYNYRNEAIVDLPMGMENHKPNNATGVELLTNGDFATGDTTGWTYYNTPVYANSDFTVTGTTATLQVGDVSVYMGAYQEITTEVGKTYVVSCDALTNASTPTFKIGTNAIPGGGPYSGNIYNGADGSIDLGAVNFVEFTATATTTIVMVQFGGAAASSFDFTNCSVKEGYSGTQDVSGNNNHATFGDGSTSSTYPTKLSARGYEGDGGSDYFDINTTLASGSYTVGMIINMKGSPANRYFMDARSNGGTGYMWVNGSSVLSPNDGTIYVDGVEDASFVVPPTGLFTLILSGITLEVLQDIILLAKNDVTVQMPCEIKGFSLTDELTPIQVCDLHINMMKKVNKI